MFHNFVKRSVDIIGAVIGLAVLAPVIPFIALAIVLDSPGPVFVRLARVSAGRTVYIYKFRSMIADAEARKKELWPKNERTDGPFFKMRRDPRVTKVGRIIRRFRIDEFPQLWNVLMGKLSLVGPRPHEPEEVKRYPPEYRHILAAKAGVTGLSQVSGASSLPFLRELELDSYYVNHQSIWLDFKIIGRTILILFSDPTAV